MKKFIALIRREILEHGSLWKVPAMLLLLAILIKMSFSFGNLSIDFTIPEGMNLDATVDSFVSTAVGSALQKTSWLITVVMFLVAIFYALSAFYEERKDQSVLFWRSLPISDSQTVLAKLAVAVVLVPVIILLLQIIVAVIFLGSESADFLSSFLSYSVESIGKELLWSILPTIAWCLLCSQIANKSPFMLALFVPLTIAIVDWLFLDGLIADFFIINRFSGVDHYTPSVLAVGLIFSALCLTATVLRRGQRV